MIKPQKPAKSLNIERKIPQKPQIIKPIVYNKNNSSVSSTSGNPHNNLNTSSTASLLQNKKTKS